MRSVSSLTDSSASSCPISWTIFFLGRSSSSIAAMVDLRTRHNLAAACAVVTSRRAAYSLPAATGANLIIDIGGGDYINRNYEAAAVESRIVQVSFLGAAKAEINVGRLMVKRLTHTGSTLRPRPVPEKAAIARAIEEKVWPLVAAGRIKPVIDSTFPLAQAAAAHARMETSQHIGKIALTV